MSEHSLVHNGAASILGQEPRIDSPARACDHEDVAAFIDQLYDSLKMAGIPRSGGAFSLDYFRSKVEALGTSR
jgi:hypothetical protein